MSDDEKPDTKKEYRIELPAAFATKGVVIRCAQCGFLASGRSYGPANASISDHIVAVHMERPS